ncbi:hypothetical protein [Nocardioides sp. LHG3406-4]|uniref:hypothetical protein n=1 Tax=Nocardioides sp. LHG3406-4 TaxID=2804575 RepID=UPI003CEE0F47
MSTSHESPVREALRAALTAAMKSRDRAAVSVYRSALAAIDNAGAQPVTDMPAAGAVEGARLGVGAADAARRELTEVQVRDIVVAEVAERRAASEEYAAAHTERAAALRQEAEILQAVLDEA